MVVKPLPDGLEVAQTPSRLPGDTDSSGAVSRELGLEVGELSEEMARQLGFKGSSGVLITGVDPRGPAFRAGIRRGTVILEVERKPVASVDQFEAALKGRSLKDGVLLKIRTQDGVQYVLLQGS